MPTPSNVIDLIKNSGNTFHAKVARWFKEHGWHTVVSPYYMDQTQGKARELDLIVEKRWPVHFIDRPPGNLVVRLFVECKFVATEAVFWFAPKDIVAANKMVCNSSPFRKNSYKTEEHHYLASCPEVAKLFASSRDKMPENEPFYKALNQALNAMVALRSKPPSLPSLVNSNSDTTVKLNFPVIVCSSFEKLYAVDFLTDSNPEVIKDNFQLEVEYAFQDKQGVQRDEYFILDFVEFKQLGKFEELLRIDADAGAFLASG